MIAATNHKAVPFFDRIPPRALPVVQRTCALIETQRPEAAYAHKTMCTDLVSIDVAPPTLDEFRVWFEEVRLGRHLPDDYRDTRQRAPCVKALEQSLQRWGVPSTIQIDADSAFRLANARGIVRAAHSLFEAKVQGGYSPLSCNTDDTIVSEAIKELLEAEATATLMDADIRMTVGNKLADLLLQQDNSDIDAKLVDCLAIDMQQEICAALVAAGAA